MATHTQLKKFGLRIQALRKAQRLSQEELALRSGLHRTYIGGIERGERNVALLNILKIAHALNVAPGELFQEADTE